MGASCKAKEKSAFLWRFWLQECKEAGWLGEAHCQLLWQAIAATDFPLLVHGLVLGFLFQLGWLDDDPQALPPESECRPPPGVGEPAGAGWLGELRQELEAACPSLDPRTVDALLESRSVVLTRAYHYYQAAASAYFKYLQLQHQVGQGPEAPWGFPR